ncbi:alanine racemase [Actinomadura verrucosospora]|uniref:Amino acid aldolase or racemase-like protein (D-serine dehydratase) n=1 Tax=Actinomadura verrucosospora TaxID=46165 RepID=A0A7D3ZHS6_ACTVE|nr:alanine racemase [Actinomadura verrucosospora]QKG24097.1 amino acid aldolase or racemase-like protein (D-serine dehydratase) [Actinomadura verrucosospora]
MTGIDAKAVDALDGEPLDWRFKAIPASVHGTTVARAREERLPLDDFGTPLLTLDAGALEHNVRLMADWVSATGMHLAPHGKTTMAPALWRRQLDAGAWGITLATFPQLRVARAFGVRRLLLAGAPLDPAGLAWLAGELDGDPEFAFVCWADSVRSVELMDEALRAARAQRRVDVCVELGGPNGRTGVRDDGDARAVADAIRAAPSLRLAGIGGYEGALAHDASEESTEAVDAYLRRLANLHGRLEYETADPVVTAGGSAFFDQVAEVLGGLDAQVVLRSGAYLVHDDGFYQDITPFGRGAGAGGERFRPAMHGWGRVVSAPEPALALLDVGRRDVPFDSGLPRPQFVRGKGAGPVEGARITALNDQHAFLRGASVEPGDIVRLGLSHPCTALDKWTMIPVVDDAAADAPVVTDYVRTFF